MSMYIYLLFVCVCGSGSSGVKGETIGPINLLSDRLLRYVLIFEYQILVLDLVVDIRTKISEGI